MSAAITSLGLVEVRGYVCAIVVADAMVKSSSVSIFAQLKLNPGLVTIVVEGSLGACEAAVAIGADVARSRGALVSVLLKGKPDSAIEDLLQNMRPATRLQTVASSPVQSFTNDTPEQALLSFLASGPSGRTMSELKQHFKANSKDVLVLLKRLENEHKIEKIKHRFRLTMLAE